MSTRKLPDEPAAAFLQIIQRGQGPRHKALFPVKRPALWPRMNDRERAVFSQLQSSAIVAVLILNDARAAVPLARALLAGGVNAMELTLRTPAALDALRAIRAEVPEMLAGIGTILSVEQVRQVVEAGGQFGVAPGTNPRIMDAAREEGLPFAPGICTPSDIERALEFDRRFLKFFPAEPSGGLKYLESIAAPYQHLGVKYIPLGGVNEANCHTWLQNKHVGGIGGSWLAPQDLIAAQDWSAIQTLAARAIAIRDAVRAGTPAS
jgi:2-dehydro-3-deoxyphosphogluconate aldolase/(4S)-4-hydroxy-2-oxoglutarate aldolase